MNRPALRRIVLAIFLAIPAIDSGCTRQVAGGKSGVTAKPVPEERYQRVLDYFRRTIEGQPIGFVVSDGTSRSTLYGTNKVSSKLTPPAAADEHYKAVITVETQSHYSLRRTKSSTDEATEREQNAKNQGNAALDDPKEKGIGILEPDLVGKPRTDNTQPAPKPKPTQPDEDVVSRRPDDEVRKYELVYDGDRWTLVTKLDPKTERSIQFAFDEALARQ